MENVAQISDTAIPLTNGCGKPLGGNRAISKTSPKQVGFRLWGISASSWYHSTRAPVRPALSPAAPAALKWVRQIKLAIFRGQSSTT